MNEHLYPHMVQEYYVERMRKLAFERDQARRNIRTSNDVLKLKSIVRRKLARSFGKLPAHTPLNPKVTGKFERSHYIVEKIIFESRPALFVTANLYIPKGKQGPFPCVLGACGHSAIGKAEPNYQFFAQGLATKGYLVLIYDPLSQGERIQYPMKEGIAQPTGCCQEHNMMGNQMSLIGEFFGKWRLWDGIRALDYLLSRPEADPTRVGVTGNSGGGTLTTYLNAFDDRFTMAAPNCFVTTYLCNLENELPADSEQIPPNIIKYGLDMSDFFTAQIPRPVILLGQNNDYFDRRGLVKTYAELKRLYTIMGAGENIRLFIGPGNHVYSLQGRQAMYAFFNKQAGIRTGSRECKTIAETPEQLAASPAGQVHKMPGKRVFDFTKEEAARINLARKRVSPAALKNMIGAVLAVKAQAINPHYRVLRARWNDTARYACHSSFAVETEPGIQAILHVFGKQDQCFYCFPKLRKVLLYVPHLSSQEDVAAGEAPHGAEPLFALDVRGMGQTKALTCVDENFFTPYGNDYFYASYADMFGKPYLGRRVHDLLSVLNLLQNKGCHEVHLMGRGLGALIAVFAACLHPLVKRVTLKNTLLSYYELTQAPVQSWPFSFMAENLLHYFDLPDCYRVLVKKHLEISSPWNSQMQAWNKSPLSAHPRTKGAGLQRTRRGA